MAAALLLLIGVALGEGGLALPDGLRSIEEEAFAGDASIRTVTLPESVEYIGARAFAGSGLGQIILPESVEGIGEDAFPQGTRIRTASRDDWAAGWARAAGYEQVSEGTRWYALVIGQGYADNSCVATLTSSMTDAKWMARMLSEMPETPFHVTHCTNLTAAGILAEVESAFAGADEDDVCLLYYAGHGLEAEKDDPGRAGAMVGVDYDGRSAGIVRMSQLRAALDRVAGDRIVILDSCYSGVAVGEMGTKAKSAGMPDLAGVNQSIVNAFAMRGRGMDSGAYYVLTAASATELSWGKDLPEEGYGIFTSCLLKGCGYDEIHGGTSDAMPADRNGDMAISLAEAYAYVTAEIDKLLANSGISQHAQASPQNSPRVLWRRELHP